MCLIGRLDDAVQDLEYARVKWITWEASNNRHDWEWVIWEDLKLPAGKIFRLAGSNLSP